MPMSRISTVLLIGLLFSPSLLAQNDTLIVVTRVAGDVLVERSGKSKRLKFNSLLEEGDLLISKKGKADIQIGPGSIVRLQPHSKLVIKTAYKKGNVERTSVKLNQGSLFTKIFNKMIGDSYFRVETPSAVAAVRGTEFLISNGDAKESDPNGVYVNSGQVAVTLQKGAKTREFIATTNEQVLLNYEDAKKEILDNYMKKKLEILSGVKLMREKSYEMLKQQRERSRENLERIREMNRKNLENIR